MRTQHLVATTELGELTFVAADDALVGLYFPGHWTRPDTTTWGPRVEHDELMEAAASQIGEYLRRERTEFEVPIATFGAPFQEDVWRQLRQIPYGARTTYTEIAAAIGAGPGGARAVGTAVGANPISIIIPCHRVVGRDGSLTGYAGGLARKQYLLSVEEPFSTDRLF